MTSKIDFIIFHRLLFKFINTMRKTEWGYQLANDIFDIPSTTICLLGTEKHGTKLHLDWARSKNWAIPVKKVLSFILLNHYIVLFVSDIIIFIERPRI